MKPNRPAVFVALFAGAMLMMTDPAAANSAEPAPDDAQSACADPTLTQLRGCSDQAAGAIAKGRAWLACQGQCAVTKSDGGAQILDSAGNTLKALPDMRFLPGSGQTACMVALPFVSAAGDLVILDAQGLEQRASQSLAPFYAVDFLAEPHLLDRVVEAGQMSCDGKRFFAPSLDGVGFAVLDTDSPFPDADAVQQGATSAIVISGTGRYALSVENGGDGRYLLQDFDSGQAHRTSAVFEIDMPFFDVEERHLLIRHPDHPGHAEVLTLPEARSLGSAPLPQDVGLNLKVMGTGPDDVLRLVPVAVPGE